MTINQHVIKIDRSIIKTAITMIAVFCFSHLSVLNKGKLSVMSPS